MRDGWRLAALLSGLSVGVVLAGAPLAPSHGQVPSPAGTGGQRLRVLVHEDPPFVIRQGPRWSGWAIDLWADVARQTGFEWDIISEATPDAIVDALAAGRVDVGVGDISVTKVRDQIIDFSHPFFRSGLRIMARTQADSVFGTMAALATRAHLGLILGVFALLAGMSVLIFVLARRHDAANFPAAPAEGAVEAVYIATVALLKGQLDRRLLPGVFARVLTIVWMFFGTAVVAYLTAAVAAVLTVQRLTTEIQSVADLSGRPVATLAGTFTGGWLRERGVDVIEQPNLDAAIAALLAHRVDAVVHDAPVLTWWTMQHPGAHVDLVGHVFERNDYAFAVPEQSPLRVTINLALLDLEEAGFFAELDRRWMEPPR